MTSLGGTTVTAEYLAEQVQEGREPKIELKDAQVSAIGEEGFMSNIFKVTFNWATECDLPSSAVVKVPTTGKILRANENLGLGEEELKFFKENVGAEAHRVFAITSHNTEIKIYKLLGSDLPILAPKMYFAQDFYPEKEQDGILMMQDLSDKASIVKIGQSLTLEQVLSVAEQLASLHAFSLTKLPKGWDKEFMEMDRKRMKTMSSMMQHMLNVALSIGKLYPDRFGELIAKLKPYYTMINFFKAYTSPSWLGMPQVLVHSDMFTCNLLWAKDDAGKPTNELVSIIDFQGTHPGNVAEDISRLLATSVSAELRRRHLDTILSHYHKNLCQKLGYEPFSLEKVHRAYKAIQPATNIFMSFGLPLFINANAMTGDNREKQAVLERTEECLKDFLHNQQTFTLTFGEKLYWYGIYMFMTVYFYFMS